MKHLEITKHAKMRLAQRAMSMADAEMIVNFGTEVEDGYIFLEKDCEVLKCELKAALQGHCVMATIKPQAKQSRV